MTAAVIATKVALAVVWATVSTTIPAPLPSPAGAVLAVYRPTMCNQVGTEYRVTTADVFWEGKTTTVELGREPTGKEEKRSIDCNTGVDYSALMGR